MLSAAGYERFETLHQEPVQLRGEHVRDMHLALRSLPSVVCTSLLSALVTDSHQQLRQLQSRSYLAKNHIAQLSC
jgi:hypothetical protein